MKIISAVGVLAQCEVTVSTGNGACLIDIP